MIRNTLLLLLVPFLLSSQKITLEDIWNKFEYYPKSPEGFNVLKDGLNYVSTEEKDGNTILAAYDMKTGNKVRDIVNGADVKWNGKAIPLKSYQFSPGEDKLLIFENAERIYRHSMKAEYYIYDIKAKKTMQLCDKGKQILPKFSPDGSKVAFVRDNNLYIKYLADGREQTVTTDGAWNKIKNGWADWVYEEEFSKPDYFDWSADGNCLAFVHFDESKVKEYTLEYFRGNLYPDKYTFKYPKAGEDNSNVMVQVFKLADGSETTMGIGPETDIYIPRINFTKDPKTLCIQRMNRLQNKLEYLFADVVTGNCKVIVKEESATYIDITDDLTFNSNKGFFITSEKDGYNHIYYYDLNGKLISQVTKGEWDVMEFKGFDETTNTLYYTSTEKGAINRDVYSIKPDGKEKKRLSQKDGHTNFEFMTGYKFYTSSYSNANTPPVHELHSIDGKLVKVLEDNAALAEKAKKMNLTPKTFMQIPMASGVSLNGWIKKPQNFDSTKKYPVYMYGYGGPGSNLVHNNWDIFDYWWHSLLNQEGYIVVCVDNRGTQGRGRAFKHSTYLQLGKLETEDQTEVANYLKTLKYVDGSRIGFQGWSFGGYLAALLISKSPDVFKCAVSVAPVTNWKYYDNIYTERFLRKPADNPAGYDQNSPSNFVKNIKGKLLLMHGHADDNVHLQNSMEMAAELVKYNIPFDFMIYPNKNHGISGPNTRLHVYSKILKFVKENL